MQQLTDQGMQVVNQIAARHGFSSDAVTHMLFAVLNGNGSMAQFNHPEFAGGGQWMRGGMIMLGDMFNNYLKGRVDALCNDLSNLLANQPGLLQSGSFQSQSQSGGYDQQSQYAGTPSGGGNGGGLFAPDKSRQWWPASLGQPNASGAQNNMRYAYFANARRLAVDSGGDVWVYDTLDHQIGGFSQQQGPGGTISLSSQYGSVSLASLPVVMRNGQDVLAAPPAPAPAPSSWNAPAPAPAPTNSSNSGANASDVFAAIERLGDLKAKGLLTEQEFNAKKAELLSRL
jgi:hypothetical protein